MRKIRNKIYLYTLLLVFAVLFIMYLLQVVFLENIYQHVKEKDVREAQIQMVEKFNEMDTESAYRAIWEIAKENEMYVAIYDEMGREVLTPLHVVVEKPKDFKLKPWMFENYRRVFMQARQYMERKHVGTYTYYGEHEEELIVVTRIDAGDGTFYILTRAPLVPVKATTNILRVNFFWGIIIAFLFAGIVAFILAQHISKPVHALSKGAKAVASGDLQYRVPQIAGESEIAVLIRDFNSMTEELSKEDKLRKDLLANVSHELRTPLTMIKGYAETVRDLTGDNPEKRNVQLGIIVEESDRLTALITDLLDLSKMQSGHVVFKQEQVDFSEMLKNIAARYECFKDKGYHIDVDVADNVYVTGDKDRLAQVVYNLTDNAINHSGDAKHVTICLTGGENVRFSVINSGPAISEEDIQYIWDRFYHVDNAGKRRVTGTGIGLSLVREILVHHGFRYGVNSEPDKTEFWFEPNRKED
ncbi:MAG: HAMP domain-containing protein [Clostridia bacterium]|nr:HAMP domain-containing protein [Clostridia bacterium]